MNVQQIYTLLNNVQKEVLGVDTLINEDLSNVVDFGTTVFNQNSVDNYVRSLVNHIGKVIFVNRPYSGKVPSVLLDAWEFGSVLEKITAEIPTATENDTWDLQDGQTYSQDTFYKPKVTAKFYNSKVTFEVPISITEKQVKESFSNVSQLNGFLSMIYDAVEKSMTIKTDALIMRTINAAIDNIMQNGKTTQKVNLLSMYNTQFTETLTAADALYDSKFIQFATYVINLYTDRLQTISTLFNAGSKERFTPKNDLKLILLTDFAKASETWLLSNTQNQNYLTLPQHDSVPYWQGSGQNYSFADVTTIKVNSNTYSGIIGIAFDKNTIGVCNSDRRVTSNYNAKAEFYNNYYKFDASYFVDTNENIIVFYLS